MPKSTALRTLLNQSLTFQDWTRDEQYYPHSSSSAQCTQRPVQSPSSGWPGASGVVQSPQRWRLLVRGAGLHGTGPVTPGCEQSRMRRPVWPKGRSIRLPCRRS